MEGFSAITEDTNATDAEETSRTRPEEDVIGRSDGAVIYRADDVASGAIAQGLALVRGGLEDIEGSVHFHMGSDAGRAGSWKKNRCQNRRMQNNCARCNEGVRARESQLKPLGCLTH